MRRTKRLTKPIVLLALTWTLFGETGCTTNQAQTPEPTDSSPIQSGLATGAPGGSDETKVAVVGDVQISRQQLLEQLLSSYGEQTLRIMMLRIAVGQESERWGISVSDDEVARELQKMSEGYDSEEQFYAARKEQLGMSREEVRKDVIYRLELEQLAIRTVSVSNDDINQYIKDHPDEFSPRTQLKLSHLVVDHQQDAEDLLSQLEAGADFSELAEANSTDSNTASSGGNLGWVEGDDPFLDPNLLEAAKSLSVGEATGPVSTKDGYELVLLTGRKDSGKEDPDLVREDARKQYALSQAPSLADLENSLLQKYGAQVLDSSLRS